MNGRFVPERCLDFPRTGIPHARQAVCASTGEKAVARRKRHAQNGRIVIQRTKEFSVLRIPNPYRTVGTPTCNHAPVETERQAHDGPGMPTQGSLVGATSTVP